MSSFPDIPVRPRKPSQYIMTEEDKTYLKSFAVNGVIPFEDYIKAMNEILNKDRV